MISYQIQYKEDTQPKPGVGDAALGVWKVVAQLPSLKSAINSAKVLIKKYGYDRVQICRVTKLNIKVEVES